MLVCFLQIKWGIQVNTVKLEKEKTVFPDKSFFPPFHRLSRQGQWLILSLIFSPR